MQLIVLTCQHICRDFIFIEIYRDIDIFRIGTNAIIFWMDWLHDSYRLTSGFLNRPEVGGRPKWSVSHRQGVHFLQESERCLQSKISIDVKADFCPNAQFLFHFQYETF